jgi:hypothetical protein
MFEFRNPIYLCLLSLVACSNDEVYTLYRDSTVQSVGRVHVSTFDTNSGESYNKENCQLAAELFQKQPGVVTKFWCEKGRFAK